MIRVLASLAVIIALSAATVQVSKRDFERCHNGVRDTTERCREFVNYPEDHLANRMRREADDDEAEKMPPPPPIPTELFPDLPYDWCMNITWEEANRDNNWGHCMAESNDGKMRYFHSNTVPDFYYNPYCPIGLGYGYCIDIEIEKDMCFFPDYMKCGNTSLGRGTTEFGDVWVPQHNYFAVPMKPNPTRWDRPAMMYDARGVRALKSVGAALGIAINGIGIYGPNDAGDVSIDEAGFQLTCGGHVTPPMEEIAKHLDDDHIPFSPPTYHFHKAPECLEPYTQDYKGISRGARPDTHGKLTGYALDGFGIYTFQDVGGAQPVVDECGGHFGPVSDDSDEVVYHYHTRPYVPYTIACQGPSLGKCRKTQTPTSNYCHAGCDADVCVQPGTKPWKLDEYLGQWDRFWLSWYKVNDYKRPPHHEELE